MPPGFHAQLTGILAGLAFTSIVLILQSSTLKGRGAEAGLLSFFSALVTLLISAFLDGTAAGEELIAGRLAIMVFLAGIAAPSPSWSCSMALPGWSGREDSRTQPG